MTHLSPNHKFIEAWGIMASTWGVSRSESQVYALLLLRNEKMSSEDIMQELHMSRGNVHAVLHTLMDYELVFKSHVMGERKEYFRAVTDLWLVMDKMVKYMKRRSLDRFVEMMETITPEQEISASSSHLEKLKTNIKGIAEVCNAMMDYIPKFNRAASYPGETGQIIQLAR